MSDLIRRRLHVTGRVQGVFFRASTRDVARANSVTGWIRNDDGGTVTAELQGEADAVDRVIAFAREGPPQAAVADVAVEACEPVTAEQAFEVR